MLRCLFLFLISFSVYALIPQPEAMRQCQEAADPSHGANRFCADYGYFSDFTRYTRGKVELKWTDTSGNVVVLASYTYLLACKSGYSLVVYSSTNHDCVADQICPDGSTVPQGEDCTHICPDGSVLSYYQSCPLFLCPNGEFAASEADCPRKRQCQIPENPITHNCIYPDDKGPPQDCMEGGNELTAGFYAFPAVGGSCPTLWDGFWSQPDKPQNCGDGTTQMWPNSCFNAAIDKTVDDLLHNPWVIGAIALTLPNPFKVFSIFTKPSGMQGVAMTLPIAVRTSALADAASAIRYSSAEVTVPNNTLGLAIKEYMYANPNSSLEQALLTKFPQGVAKEAITINPSTGEIILNSTGLALSNTQTAATALASHALTTAELNAISPFLRLDTIPWLLSATDAIEGDFWRVYDDKYTEKQPINFPETAWKPLALSDPQALADPHPVAELGPESPQTYNRPKPTTTTTPQDNPNPTDDPGTVVADPDPVGPVNPNDPNSVEQLPKPPELYPDTWKYFEWLPFNQPFTWSPGDYVPTLPESSCTYEVHTSFNTHYFGTHHIDFAPCEPLQPLRDVLAWVFSVLTGFICFNVVFRSTV